MTKKLLENRIETFHKIKLTTDDPVVYEACKHIIEQTQFRYKELSGHFYVVENKK